MKITGIVKNLQIVFFAYALLVGCRQSTIVETDGIAVIDVVNNLGKYQAIPASRFVSELEYIPLETGDNCLIAGIRDIIVTISHIFVVSNDCCYTFDRTGRFLGPVGRIGQGPGEYIFVIGLSIDKKNQSLYLETPRNMLEYSWDGEFLRSINLPQSTIGSPLGSVFIVQDNLFIGHVRNYGGNEPYNFILFDGSGEVVKSFDNRVKLDRTRPRYFVAEDAIRPLSLSESIYVKENANDTLFRLNEQHELIPQFVFNLGKYVFTKEHREAPIVDLNDDASYRGGVIVISSPHKYSMPMIGFSSYIFFSIWAVELPKSIPFPKQRVRSLPPGLQNTPARTEHDVMGIYDIVNQKTQLLDTDPVSSLRGLINDLDGGLTFWPRYYTSENELIDIWQAHDMKEILTEEYFAAHEIKDAQAHQKLKELLKKLDWEDNPIIVIGKLK